MKKWLVLFVCLFGLLIAAITKDDTAPNTLTRITSDPNGSISVGIYGILYEIGIELSGTADNNDANGLDITYYDDFDKVIHTEVNATDGWRCVLKSEDANENPYGGIIVAGPVDTNFVNVNTNQTVTFIYRYRKW